MPDRVNAVASCRHCTRLEPVRLTGELYASVPVCCGDAMRVTAMLPYAMDREAIRTLERSGDGEQEKTEALG